MYEIGVNIFDGILDYLYEAEDAGGKLVTT